MTTTVVKIVGTLGGADYTSWQSWEDDCPPDLRAGTGTDQIWEGQQQDCTLSVASGTLLTISGPLTDAGHYLHMTTVPGASWRDKAGVQTNTYRYNAANGAAISSSAGYAWIISCSVDFTRISNLQIQCTASQGRGVNMAAAALAEGTCSVDYCIIEGLVAASSGSIAPLVMYGANQAAHGTLVVQRGSSQPCIVRMSNGASAYNCTFAAPSNVAIKPSYAIIADAAASHTSVIENCALMGASNVYTGFTPTFITCYTDAVTLPSGCTNITYSASGGTKFVNITNGTHDYRLQSGSGLIDVGTTDATNAAVDAAGTTRPQGGGYDVGAWEFKASGGTPGTAPGTTVAIAAEMVTTMPTGAGTAPATMVLVAADLLTGTATGAAQAAGTSQQANADSVAGSAAGAAAAPAVTLAVDATPIGGAAAGAGLATGATVAGNLEPISGAASTGATALGTTVVSEASYVTTSPAGAAMAPGTVVTAEASWLAGVASATIVAAGTLVATTAEAIGALATGAAEAIGNVVAIIASYVRGSAIGDIIVGPKSSNRLLLKAPLATRLEFKMTRFVARVEFKSSLYES